MTLRLISNLLICTVFAASTSAVAADAPASTDKNPTASDFFHRGPLAIISQIPANNRLDMLDYFESGSTVKVNNRLGAKVGLKSVDDRMVSYEDEDSITTALVVLPTAKNDTILMVLRTTPSPMADTSISFFDSKWQPLKAAPLSGPALSDWALDKTVLNDDFMGIEVPFMLQSAEYDPSEQTLTFTNRLDKFYVGSDRPKQLDKLNRTLTYKWNGKKFVRLAER